MAISPDLTRNEKNHQRPSGGPITLDVSGAETYDTTLAIAPSPLDAQVIWAGTDDGLVQLTRDGGTHWNAVTPRGWPKYGRVETIDASPSAAGTAFVILDRHDLGDNHPYVFATDDFGATWRAIAANLPHDAPVRVVRQDPREPNLLYAGTENGLWISYDRGGRWERMPAKLPVVPVYDLHVQPSANDLLVATHGRGFFVFDDLGPVQRLAAARRAGVAFFPVRDATLWASWQSIETGDGNALTNDRFVGPNAPSGALLTFYQRAKSNQRPWFEILDASGRVVRTLRGSYPTDSGKKWYVTNDAGLNRITWDGNEDGPTQWLGTVRQNMGPLSGPVALPGTYTARLHIRGRTFDQSFRLGDDPQSPWTLDQRRARHAFLATAYGWYDRIDRVLNLLDERLKKASPAERARLYALRGRLTSNALYDEDSVGKPDQIRERVSGYFYLLGGSMQPPFAQHQAALDALRPDVDAALRDAAAVLGTGFTPVTPPPAAPTTPAASPSPGASSS